MNGQAWTKDQIEYVIIHYPYERAEDVGNALGRSAGAVMHIARSNGVHKDSEALSKIMSVSNSGANSGNFNGYRARKDGYILRYVPDHPCANSRGYIGEHRLVVEEHLGIILPKEFVVHHLNGVKDDNRIENLAVMTVGAHSALHGKMGRKMPKGETHCRYKKVDISEINRMRSEGYTVDEVCEKLNICKFTYYKKMRGNDDE